MGVVTVDRYEQTSVVGTTCPTATVRERSFRPTGTTGRWPSDGRRGRERRKYSVPSDVRQVLASHPVFSNHVQSIRVELDRDTLKLTGQLPSYFTKQLLQETLRSVEGVEQIENRVCVVYQTDFPGDTDA